MALPNYTPSGTIRFGSVPWDSSYNAVRLYGNLSEQSSDIASMMDISSSKYSYIARERRLKVAIEADRLYHCNYCMYRNASLGDGWIYCFVSNVTYVNDNTTEIELSTDVFQTYLMGTDWTMPPTFIERSTVATEAERYMLTNEPEFSLIYEIDGIAHKWFTPSGAIIMCNMDLDRNDSLIDQIINPSGFFATGRDGGTNKGILNGCEMFFCKKDPNTNLFSTAYKEIDASFLKALNMAGASDSVVSIFTVPDLDNINLEQGWVKREAQPDSVVDYQGMLKKPSRGTSLDGYTPHNKKLLYYPYTFMRLTDYNGSLSEIRYELMEGDNFYIKYALSPTCKAFVYPEKYQGVAGLSHGITVDCGAQGSWNNNQYQTWLAQNAGAIGFTVAAIALAGVTGGASLAMGAGAATASTAALGAEMAATAASGMKTAALMGIPAALSAQELGKESLKAAKQPTVTRGVTDYNTFFTTGMQGVHVERVCCKAEIAQQIDQYFDRFGYQVDRIESVNVSSRRYWNYIQTSDSTPRSANATAGSSAPFSRGRGTPAEALAVIKSAFDSGVTFWHTTSGFGNYSQDNTI